MNNNDDILTKLQMRLASGDITEEEYDRILRRIRTDDDSNGMGKWSHSKSSESGPTIQSTSYFTRLWYGRIDLVTTFWVWGTFVAFLITMAATGLAPLTTDKTQITGLKSISLIWSIFMAVAIIRSAALYRLHNPTKIWGRLAQVMAVIDVAVEFFDIISNPTLV